MKKNILVVAMNNKVEALRVAIGLTLLSDIVKIVVVGELGDAPAIHGQKEVLEFAEVPCEELRDAASVTVGLSRAMTGANVVYVI